MKTLLLCVKDKLPHHLKKSFDLKNIYICAYICIYLGLYFFVTCMCVCLFLIEDIVILRLDYYKGLMWRIFNLVFTAPVRKVTVSFVHV